MTLEEARAAVGRKVVYRPPHWKSVKRKNPGPWAPEEGVITSVNDSFVFVRYGSQAGSAATNAENLEFTS